MIKSIFLTAFDLTKKNAIVLIGFFLSIVLLSFLMGLLGELLRQQIIASVVYNIFSLLQLLYAFKLNILLTKEQS